MPIVTIAALMCLTGGTATAQELRVHVRNNLTSAVSVDGAQFSIAGSMDWDWDNVTVPNGSQLQVLHATGSNQILSTLKVVLPEYYINNPGPGNPDTTYQKYACRFTSAVKIDINGACTLTPDPKAEQYAGLTNKPKCSYVSYSKEPGTCKFDIFFRMY
jgi:hypothetical protein